MIAAGVMKVGDLVTHINTEVECGEVGIIVDIISKKCWRTSELGPRIDWERVDPEPHGVVMYHTNIHSGPILTIPIIELVVVNESR
jgi:hypothetical protein